MADKKQIVGCLIAMLIFIWLSIYFGNLEHSPTNVATCMTMYSAAGIALLRVVWLLHGKD
jgi:hypothetical protein